jgi:acetyl coenzyme A synthetase (ADP forming)-like protein
MTTSTSGRSSLPLPAPVILRDGTTAWLRPARPDDADRLGALFSRASRESLWFRFFTPTATVSRRFIESVVTIDGTDRMTLLVTRGEGTDEQVLAVGSYARLPTGSSADIAFFVDEELHGQGLGTLLLERLAEHAHAHGIDTLVADTMIENRRMLDVFRASGFATTYTTDRGVVHVRFPTAPTEEYISRAEARERTATVASLAPFFTPRAVAVIGASRDQRSIGRMVLDRLIQGGFQGPVYPVNPHARSVAAVRAYGSILDVPDSVDLAVIAVPSQVVAVTVDQCAQKGVRALVVLSAGFAETGPEGRGRQDELVRKVRAHGMRMIGPNCMGILNTAPDVQLNATFGPTAPRRGRVAMSSQSGALGLAILAEADQLGLGISMFVSVGNKADVSGNDLIQYWETDPDTNLIVLYLESFGNPRKFSRIARRIARQKPILAVKSGRTTAGSRAALSHTAALAGSDRAVDALFRQAGVIRADTLEELFGVAMVLTNQPLPRGKRVAIVTNAGGPGILCADACEAAGLQLPALADETLDAVRSFLPATAGLANPIDMIASAGPTEYERTTKAVMRDPNVDSVIVIYTPAGMAGTDEIAAAIRHGVTDASTAGAAEKPVLTCIISGRQPPTALSGYEGGGSAETTRPIPVFRFPESAAQALARTVRYAEWRGQPPGRVPELDGVDDDAARSVVAAAIHERGDGWLNPSEVARLLGAAGIRLPAFEITASPDEAAAAAERIGFPVAVKLISPTLTHKSDIGGVVLDVTSRDAVRQACAGILERVPAGTAVDGFLVQRMVEGGTEVIVGVVDDGIFGPLVGFGLGGTAVEILNDVAFRITPLTDADAHEMVRSIRSLPLLQGYRGRPPAGLDAVEDLLLRISWLVETVPEIAEMDANPVKVFEPGQGVALIDVRVYVRGASSVPASAPEQIR